MKYRIVTDGESFYVQGKWLFFWLYFTHPVGFFGDTNAKLFKTEKDAVDFCRGYFGDSGTRVRYIRPV